MDRLGDTRSLVRIPLRSWDCCVFEAWGAGNVLSPPTANARSPKRSILPGGCQEDAAEGSLPGPGWDGELGSEPQQRGDGRGASLLGRCRDPSFLCARTCGGKVPLVLGPSGLAPPWDPEGDTPPTLDFCPSPRGGRHLQEAGAGQEIQELQGSLLAQGSSSGSRPGPCWECQDISWPPGPCA